MKAKNKLFKILVAIGIALIFASCSKDNTNGTDINSDLGLNIVPYIDNDLQVSGSTRAPITSVFGLNPDGTQVPHYLGFCMTKASNPSESYYDDPLSKNFEGKIIYRNYSYSWTYNLTNVGSTSILPLSKIVGNALLTSYHPYDENITDITKIPFDLNIHGSDGYAVLNDYIYSPTQTINPNSYSGLSNYNIAYWHLTSLLHFKMKYRAHQGDNIKQLLKIIVSTEDGGAWLLQKGNYDPTTGNILNDGTREYVSSMTFAYQPNTTSSTTFDRYIMLAPYTVTSSTTDKKLKIEFVFGDPDTGGISNISGPLILDLATMTAGSDYGLVAGYKYTMTISFQNYTIIESFDQIPGEAWDTIDHNITI